ncbi:Uncharacterised protein [Mycolicibacterium aurum]|uniref:Uncharacterized protein n=1 Tax=Mycolicibacterium aurum TaxID=1791 RepID=A0A3S4S283_MYCAU|nr:hypothetical protein [Mycolicibacterium aurum]VEG58146.1 Uncharacterised protein [Mycolicibacterium aurum]
MSGKTFETWWEESGQHWAAAVVENGGTLWTDDIDERRELFDRRHQRPEAPTTPTLTRIPRSHAPETTAERTAE